MSRGRDNQRSRVYAFERAATNGGVYRSAWESLDECERFLRPIWRAERGRLGRAKVDMPSIVRPHRGQRSAIAHSYEFKITLPKWARNPWVVLHEAAHHLTPRDEAHGPRFFGVLIGLVARHDGRDAAELMALADEMGVKYHVRSIGVVPIRGVLWQLDRVLREHEPMTEMELACWLDVSYLQVRGAAMGLVRRRIARWLRGKLVVMPA